MTSLWSSRHLGEAQHSQRTFCFGILRLAQSSGRSRVTFLVDSYLFCSLAFKIEETFYVPLSCPVASGQWPHVRGTNACCVLELPFQLAIPPGFQVDHNPKGNLVLYLVLTYTCVLSTVYCLPK